MEPYWYLGCSNPYSLKLLSAICAAVMDVLRCIVLGLQGNLGPGGLNGTCKYEGEEDLTIQRVLPATCIAGSS